MNWIAVVALFLTALLGGVAGLALGGSLNRNIKLLLAFSGAYILSLSILHLLPEIFSVHTENIGMFIIYGFLFQILLEYFSKGVEHGHIHKEDMKPGVFPFAIFISLCLHSVVEGMPLGSSSIEHEHHHHGEVDNGLLLGIIIHKIPEAIAITALLYTYFKRKSSAIFMIAVYGLATPLGMLLGYLLSQISLEDPQLFYARLLAVVVGIFLHVSTTILFESSQNHKFNFAKLAAVVLGFSVCYFTI